MFVMSNQTMLSKQWGGVWIFRCICNMHAGSLQIWTSGKVFASSRPIFQALWNNLKHEPFSKLVCVRNVLWFTRAPYSFLISRQIYSLELAWSMLNGFLRTWCGWPLYCILLLLRGTHILFYVKCWSEVSKNIDAKTHVLGPTLFPPRLEKSIVALGWVNSY